MQLDHDICEKARLARDHRFDGLFFIGVHSTGIFCRPICPARSPKPEHIVYYPSAAAAMEAGLRPCLRCRPEASPGTPAWNGTSSTVSRAMTLIRQGVLNEGRLDELSSRLGVGSRHLRRLFRTHLGVSPSTIAMTQKVLFAKKLINETDLPMTRIAFASGFGSIRRFNAAIRKFYAKTPSGLRRRARRSNGTHSALFCCTLRLSYRPPLDWPAMLAFFAQRAIPGVECVEGAAFHRTIRINDTAGTIRIAPVAGEHALALQVSLSGSQDLLAVVERVRRMFDLDADMGAIHAVLNNDPLLEQLVCKQPGLRLPGAWDPFEAAVRAVAGQQVSIKAARTVIGRIAAQAGPACDHASHDELTHFFPRAAELDNCVLQAVGMPRKRLDAIKSLARAAASGAVNFSTTGSLSEFIDGLTCLPGIGAWTANYIAMRALGEPDAFPVDDLGLVRALQQDDAPLKRAQILDRAQSWRPWRAYAAIHLWNQ